MRSPDRGHTSCLPSEIFCDPSNYIAQIMSKYPNLFPEYLHSIESSVNSENTAAHGQTSHVPLHSTIKHFPDARDRKLRITPYKNHAKSDIAMMKLSDLCLRVNDILHVRKKQRPALVHGAIPRRRKCVPRCNVRDRNTVRSRP
jgi:hypothetical protein